MKYKNANHVLPKELVSEIQKYINGEIIYIPRLYEARKKWGETSGYRHYLSERNKEIKQKFKAGWAIHRLSTEYNLSYDSIRKIIYSK